MIYKLILNSGQRFKVEHPLIFKILYEIENQTQHIDEIRENLGIGRNKIETYNYYLRIMDLVEYENKNFSLTNLGNFILKFRDYPDITQPILYYKLCRGWDNGGHFYYSRIVNNILYDKYFSSENIITNEEIRDKLLDFKSEYDKLDPKLVSLVTRGLNSNEGLGYLGILEQLSRGKFKIHSYKPNHLISAYIIYDRWPSNVSTLSFDNIIYDEFNLGRIFLLRENEVIAIFSKLQQEDYIQIEDKAGLRQIAKNPSTTTENILEEIVDEYFPNTFSG